MGKEITNMPNHDLMKPMINHTAETSIAIELTVNDGDSVVDIFPYFNSVITTIFHLRSSN